MIFGLLDGVRRKQELAEATHKASLAAIAAEQAALEANASIVRESANIFNQDDTGVLFDLYNYTTGDAIDESSFVTMQRNAYQAWATDGFAHGWIEVFVKYVVGRSCRLTAADENDETQEWLDDFMAGWEWPDGRREKPWSARAEEWVRRNFRDGESIVRKYVNAIDGKVYIRFLNPLWVRSPFGYKEEYSFGVLTLEDDIERALKYAYFPKGYSYTPQTRSGYVEIPATQIYHSKIADADAKRGRPLLLPVIADLVELNKLLRARRKLNWLRSLYAVEKTIKGTWPNLNKALHDKAKTSAATDSTGTKEVAPREGTALVHNENVSYEFKTPNLQASDADSDIRRHGLKILVGLGLSEVVGLGDASNNNYSAGELAESPMVTTMRFWQGFYEPFFKQLGRDVIQAGIDSGNLKGKRETEVEVQFPILNPRDIEKETRALALQHEEGWVSKRTAQIRLDLNPDYEDEQLEKEMAEMGTEGMEAELNGTDTEMRRILNQGSQGNTGNGAASAARRTRQLVGRARSGGENDD